MRAIESGLVPDPILRLGIRRVCGKRLVEQARRDARRSDHVGALSASPVAEATARANGQHYEVPPAFFETVLGPRLKYSCGYFPRGDESLAEAEEAALELVMERAELADGQRILELGCGWGSLTLEMARRLPKASIVAVSNSASQRRFIEERARARGIRNVRVITADMNRFAWEGAPFDRVVSVEMFEHMRNWRELLSRIARWMTPEGRLFLHVFAHRRHAYLYEDRGPADWMARHFFTGGQMPSEDLILAFQEDLVVTRQWRLSGTHYQKTAEAWLSNLDLHRDRTWAIFEESASPEEARRMVRRWRVFFMACAELFGYREGNEWGVCHYLLRGAAS